MTGRSKGVDVPEKHQSHRRQHYVPCCYLRNFSIHPERDRQAPVWLFDGTKSRDVTVESQCFGEFLYSRKDPKNAEELIRDNFELHYPRIAEKLINSETICDEDRFHLFMFMLSMYARSPDFNLLTEEERIGTIPDIIASLLHRIVPIAAGDSLANENHPQRIMAKFGFFTIRLKSKMWTCDNPCIPWEDSRGGALASVIMMAINPFTVAFFYRNDLYWHSPTEPQRSDIEKLYLAIRGRRRKFTYYPVNPLVVTRDTPMPRDNYIRPSVGERQISHSLPIYEYDFTFLVPFADAIRKRHDLSGFFFVLIAVSFYLIWSIRRKPNNLCPECGWHNLQPRTPGKPDGWICDNPKCGAIFNDHFN